MKKGFELLDSIQKMHADQKYNNPFSNLLYEKSGSLSMKETEALIAELEKKTKEVKIEATLDAYANTMAKIFYRLSKGETLEELSKEFGIEIPVDSEDDVYIVGQSASMWHGRYFKSTIEYNNEAKTSKSILTEVYFCSNDERNNYDKGADNLGNKEEISKENFIGINISFTAEGGNNTPISGIIRLATIHLSSNEEAVKHIILAIESKFDMKVKHLISSDHQMYLKERIDRKSYVKGVRDTVTLAVQERHIPYSIGEVIKQRLLSKEI